MEKQVNGVGEVIHIVGVVAIGLTLLGAFWMAFALEDLVLPLIIGVVGALQGLMLVGFGEVLNLLQGIKASLHK